MGVRRSGGRFSEPTNEVTGGAVCRAQERKTVEECTKSIVNKLLHGCMAALRCDGTDPEVCPRR